MADTISSALRRAAEYLQQQSDSPELDARLLLAHTLGVSTTRLYINAQPELAEADNQRFTQLIERRAAGEPLAYITGTCGFWNLELTVTPDVLIPRPDTETLVETALDTLPAVLCSVADLGTGSGAIALALAHERPQWSITATDSSEPALACAKANAQHLDLNNIDFHAGDWFEPLGGMRFDTIISNPPYVAPDDKHLEAPELTYEPDGALVTAAEGLAAIAHITHHAGDHLNPGGWLLLEHGYDQGRAVRTLLTDRGFQAVRTQPDLAGRDRVTLGRAG